MVGANLFLFRLIKNKRNLNFYDFAHIL